MFRALSNCGKYFRLTRSKSLLYAYAMPRVTYVEFDGTERVAEVRLGQTVMEGAVENRISAIVADCGGLCACSTCHLYVDDAWLAACGERTELEDGMLDFAVDVRANSRLSCQIRITDALDGLIVHLPERQF